MFRRLAVRARALREKLRKPATRGRRRVVTHEPLRVASGLVGRRLASPGRRVVALVVDLFLVVLLGLPLTIAVSAVGIHLQAPELLPLLLAIRAEPAEEERARLRLELESELLRQVARRHPETLPPAIVTAIENDDRQALEKLLGEWRIAYHFNFRFFATPQVRHADAGTKTVRVNVRSLLGAWAFVISGYACVLAYFTLWLRLLPGATPGKRLFRTRVVRLDGGPLSLWDAFSRAGGYSASVSTLALGFLQALWDPNRQTLHDKIAGTVVVLDRTAEVDGTGDEPVAVSSPS